MKHVMVIRALGSFSDNLGNSVGGDYEEWGGVKDLKENFSGKFKRYDLATLKTEIRLAMLDDDFYWQWLNMDEGKEIEGGDGFHFVAMNCWSKVYPEASKYLRFSEDYHFVMLKLLVKKCIWEIFWPDEELVEYKQPESGMLPYFKT